MKRKLYLLAGFVAVLLMAVAFVACEKEETPGGGGGGGDDTYSIVGTWKATYQDYYYGNASVTIRLKSDHTGSYTTKSSEGTYTVKLNYNYDPVTCMGEAMMTDPTYGESMEIDFKVKWYGANTIVIYSRDPYYGDEGDWGTMGTFERQ